MRQNPKIPVPASSYGVLPANGAQSEACLLQRNIPFGTDFATFSNPHSTPGQRGVVVRYANSGKK